MKKVEIEKTKPTIIILVLKVDIIKVGLVFSISNFFITKTPLANNWRRKKIPSCSYLALIVLISMIKKDLYFFEGKIIDYLWPIIVVSFWGPELLHFKESKEMR